MKISYCYCVFLIICFLIISACSDNNTTNSNNDDNFDYGLVEVHRIDNNGDTTKHADLKYLIGTESFPKTPFKNYFGKGNIYLPYQLGLPDAFPPSYIIESFGYITEYSSRYNIYKYKYNNQGFLEEIDVENKFIISFTYDSLNRLINIRTNASTYNFEYNAQGFISKRIKPALQTYNYNGNGLLEKIKFRTGTIFSDFLYDDDDNLTEMRLYDSMRSYRRIINKFDNNGNIVEVLDSILNLQEYNRTGINYDGDSLKEVLYYGTGDNVFIKDSFVYK